MNKGLPAILVTRTRLAKGRLRWTGALPAEPGVESGDARIVGRPEADLRVDESRNGGLHVAGRIRANVEARCRRCLSPDDQAMDVAIDLRLEPGVLEADEAPGLYGLDAAAEEVDLWPALREELVLALPEFPVCRPDCKGLCGSCGADRNEGDCGCKPGSPDSRWDGLRALSGSGSENEENKEG